MLCLCGLPDEQTGLQHTCFSLNPLQISWTTWSVGVFTLFQASLIVRAGPLRD